MMEFWNFLLALFCVGIYLLIGVTIMVLTAKWFTVLVDWLWDDEEKGENNDDLANLFVRR